MKVKDFVKLLRDLPQEDQDKEIYYSYYDDFADGDGLTKVFFSGVDPSEYGRIQVTG